MSASKLLSITKDEAQTLLKGDTVFSGQSIRCIGPDPEVCTMVESLVNASLIECRHSFRLERLEVRCMTREFSEEFKRRISRNSNIYFLFHGTNHRNHDSIFEKGFLMKYWGSTDKGYFGKGMYFTPHIEYSASYIDGTRIDGTRIDGTRIYGTRDRDISLFDGTYTEPIQVGGTCKILGCVAIVGTTKRLYQTEYGIEIPEHLDSHWAEVDSQGYPTGDASERLAVEYVIREPENIYPRFRLTLKRVTLELVWVDPDITSAENSGHVRRLKDKRGIFVYATSKSSNALHALKKKKEGTSYRAMTAGEGGKEFVHQLWAEGIQCPVLVFCQSVAHHETWARDYSKVKVTSSVSEMMDFATWRRV